MLQQYDYLQGVNVKIVGRGCKFRKGEGAVMLSGAQRSRNISLTL